jgi:hypothetical protein
MLQQTCVGALRFMVQHGETAQIELLPNLAYFCDYGYFFMCSCQFQNEIPVMRE